VISAILLAAGTSSRFGKKNKLLAKYKKESLLSYSLNNLLKSKVKEIIVVTGNETNQVMKQVPKNSKIKTTFNKNYKKGMSSSILAGIKKINKKHIGFLICLSDMPKIKFSTYNKIISSFKKNITVPCVPFYKLQNGNPVCFPIKYISKLRKLKGDQGAKKIIEKNKFRKVNINSKSVLIDFDKSSDFKK